MWTAETMRTKSNKEPKRATESDLKLNLSVPKVVLDANDCAKLLDGTGKTSVILVERGGKMVPASSSSSLTPSSSDFSLSVSASLSSSSSALPKSPGISNISNSIEAIPAKSPKLCQDATASTSQASVKISTTMPGSGQRDIVEQGEVANYVQETASSEHGKMILKPPKKRRGNDKGAYDDSSSSHMVNGEAGHSIITPSPNLHSLVDVKESVGHRSTPSFPIISTPSSSVQKHTIENLLQVSPSFSSSSSSSNNNNNDNSSNMNLISGPYSHHQTYNAVPHSLNKTSANELCSQTTIPPHSVLTLSSSSSSSSSITQPASQHLPITLPSVSLSSTPVTSSVHTNSLESKHHANMNSNLVYSYSSQGHTSQAPQTHPHVSTVLSSESDTTTVAPVLSSSQPALPTSSISPSSSSLAKASFPRPPEQDEPINLSTSSKPGDKSSTIPSNMIFSDEQENVSLPRSEKHLIHLNTPDGEKISNIVPSGIWKQNSDLSYAETNGIPHLQKKNSSLSEEDSEKRMRKTSSVLDTEAVTQGSLSNGGLNDEEKFEKLNHIALPSSHPAATLKTDCHDSVKNLDQDSPMSDEIQHGGSGVSVSKELNSEKEEKSSLLQRSEDFSKNMTEDNKTTAISDVSQEVISTPKPKKSSKKRVEIPMDAESCAMRSSSYSESIDHVIHNFEYVSEPVDEEIYLTEEEEAILRLQFDGGGSGAEVSSNNHQNKAGLTNEDKVTLQSNQEEASSKVASKSSKKGESKKPHKEKLSPSMQNVVSVITSVAADVENDSTPVESGLLDLEAILKSLGSKCQKKISQLSDENGSSDENIDTKTVALLKKAKKTLSDISLFYPSESMDAMDKSVITESEAPDLSSTIEDSKDKSATLEDSKDISVQASSSSSKEIKNKPKKPKKRKSETSAESNETTLNSKMVSTSSQADVSKPKKLKKKSPQSTAALKKSSNLVDDPSVLTTQANGGSPCQSSVKMETSDIGESIASASGGSEQMTPVHEPDIKDEGVNTDHRMDESHDTGLESAAEDKDNKPVRHYKKRLDFVKCPQCEHQARGRSALSRHMKKAHLLEADMPYKCHLCSYGCTKMASLNRHLFTHSVFPCSRCDFKTDERDKLTEHVAEQHKDKLDMKLCKVCNRYIKCESFTIEQHTEKCQGPVPYKCTECSKEFKYASSLRVHYHTHFPDEPKRFKCELCDYRTNYKANLHKHHKNMHATKDRDVQCPDCNKMFSTEDNMRRHRKVHTLVRPFACETCKKTFKTPAALKGHQLIHTATRPFTCNITGCNRSFRTQKFLKSHQEEFHRLAPKKFFCQVEGCNYSFFKRSHLKRHAITHTGERNYHCTWPGCSKSFRHADNLKVHFRGHSMEKSLQCHLCDFKCKQKNSLFLHKKKVHQIVDASVMGAAKHGENGMKVTPSSVNDETGVKDSSKDPCVADEAGSVPPNEASSGSNNDEGGICTPSKPSTSPSVRSLPKGSGGSMDLYEFKSDGESEEEGPSPLRWESVKSIPATPLPPPPKELLLKYEQQEKKERDKAEKVERREQQKKEKAEKKEQDKKEKAEKKELEKKEKAEKREQEKKEREEKKEQEKKEKLEQKEKEKKEKEEQKEKEKKEKDEHREKEKKLKDEQKEKEKKEKEELKEKEKLERIQQKEKEKCDKEAQKEKERKDKERKKMEVKRLKEEAKRIIQRCSTKSARSVTRKTLASSSFKSTAKGKKPVLGMTRKSQSRAATLKETEEKKPGRGRKKTQASIEDASKNEKPLEGVRRKRGQGNKSPINDSSDKLPSRSASPRAASPRGAKSPAAVETKTAVVKGKKKAASLPKRKPSARIKANQKSQAKKKKVPAAIKKSVTIAFKKAVVGKRGRPSRSKLNETSKSVNEDDDGAEGDDEETKVEEEEKEMKTVEEKVVVAVVEKDKPKVMKENGVEEKKVPSRAPSPSSSEEDMLQGKASPYRDFSDAETAKKEEEEEAEKALSSLESSHNEEAGEIEAIGDASRDRTEEESGLPESEKTEGDENETNEQSEVYPEESSDDEGINDIPLTPPRAPAPPPMESSEDEMEPDTLDSSVPYSTPAPNTPFSVPGPNTPFSVPPPTNLMQQHSVHSEEMATGVSSVASMDMPSSGSVEMQQPLGSVESHPVGSVEMHPRGSTEMHPNGSVEMHLRGSSDVHSHGSVEIHSHGSVEMPPRSVEIHPQGSVEMHHRNSTEMHPHAPVDLPVHGAVDMHSGAPADLHSHGNIEMHTHGTADVHPHGSLERSQSLAQGDIHQAPQSVPPTEGPIPQDLPPTPAEMTTPDIPSHDKFNLPPDIPSHDKFNLPPDIPSHDKFSLPPDIPSHDKFNLPPDIPSHDKFSLPPDIPSHDKFSLPPDIPSHDKFSLPPVLDNNEGNTSEADKRYFDQYLKNLSAVNNQAARSGNLIGSPESRDLMNKSPSIPLQSAVPTSVITTMDNPSFFPAQADLRRMEAMVGERHPDSLYARDSMSALTRMPDRQSAATPLIPTNHATPAPTFDAFPPLNPLHSSSAAARDNTSYLRQQENLFATPPVTSSFMAEAMFPRQSMTTPFLPPPPQHTDSLSRIPDPTALRTNNTSSLLRRSSAMPGSEMFTAPTVPQAVPRHPLTNAWSGQEVRPTHWQNPYLPRQPNMATANNPFFPAKENYLAGREFMFDPSAVRSPTERGMFSSLASTQSQDSLQFDRFDLSNFFPSAVTPYGTSASTLDYTRTSHSAAPKPFDERYRQTASAALPDFRGLPPTSASTDMFPSIGVNSGFNLYPSNHPMPYHPQHMTDNMNSAFLTHPSTAQHAMLERDYAAAAAHRGLYPHHHQNTSYPFIDERQYSGSSKLSHTHATPTTVAQERDLMSRSAAPESQMQDPYRSMLYRY